ncbi:TetR/AcrR family transcriptional regulator [Asticcacaulis sp. BYS171W]|uniref:TetR/AcrR family transcriptional regulator n=1 Tax=Asticcacaulis aquaticus TaxID=2984212 RepID=A0ABT5HXN2_9CAUL|nr:TetR/AcrR family transcriptional regulator [Asticcacaulis aquaticus]MDC7684216.1 TetR/AcrR family transcriptional regulator [Asticcacaulis aquaticus]
MVHQPYETLIHKAAEIDLSDSLDLNGVCGAQSLDPEACVCKPKARGRPRAYNPDEVLQKALKVFWQKGFAATSLDDLVEATGVNRPSLYAGFGDKESLYLKAMQRYRESLAERLDEVLICNGDPNDTVLSIIRRYFDIIIDTYTGESQHPLGCAFMCTALNEAPQHESILEMLQNTIEEFDIRFEKFFADGQKYGCLKPGHDPKVLAQMIGGITANLGVRARAGASAQELRSLVVNTTAMLFA